jgi:hypothetical protein
LDCRSLDLVELNALDHEGWTEFLATMRPAFAEQLQDEDPAEGDQQKFDALAKMVKDSRTGVAYVAPRGLGLTAWNPDERKQTQIRRRFMLLGQTRDGMRVWDVARAAVAIREVVGREDLALRMRGERQMAGVALYASLFTPKVTQLDLLHPSKSHHEGPIFLNVLRFLDMPQAVALAMERSNVVVHQDSESGWGYPQQLATKLGWRKGQFQICEVPEPKSK